MGPPGFEPGSRAPEARMLGQATPRAPYHIPWQRFKQVSRGSYPRIVYMDNVERLFLHRDRLIEAHLYENGRKIKV